MNYGLLPGLQVILNEVAFKPSETLFGLYHKLYVYLHKEINHGSH
jgi:hypothetical protein